MRIMSRMQDYHVAGQLCDITLVAGDRRIAAHRLVLSSASDYFEAMFTNDVVEATQSEVNIHDVDPDALEHLVQYMYTGNSFCVRDLLSLYLWDFDTFIQITPSFKIDLLVFFLFDVL